MGIWFREREQFCARESECRLRNHKPKQWTEDEVQTLIKVINAGSTAIEIATELGRYIASVAGDIAFCCGARGALHRDSRQPRSAPLLPRFTLAGLCLF
jgi:hypothetical protein